MVPRAQSKSAARCFEVKSAAGNSILLDEPSLGTSTKASRFTLVRDSETAALGAQEFVLCCVKGNQVAASLPSLQPLVGANTTLVVVQV